MIVLVPLSRFRVNYEVAAGRPFSQFERLILRAIREGASELSELQDTFQVHPRLLIEGLVTLTHAGWVAIGGPGHEGFVLTSGGEEAATSDQPPSTTEVASRQAFVVMERLSGALIANSEVRFASRRELRDVWDQAIRLGTEVTDNKLDEGQVQHLLPRRQGEWLRWIGPIDMLTKGANWLPVSVNVRGEEIVGLPDTWAPRLQRAILERAREVESTTFANRSAKLVELPVIRQKHPRTASDKKDPGVLHLPEVTRSIAVSQDDFCFTFSEHEDVIVRAMNEARSSLFVASPRPNTERLELLRVHIETALGRGVNVDLLFGEAEGGDPEFRAVSDWCNKTAYHARQGNGGDLRFSRQASKFFGNILLWDGPGGFTACVGSYNWLALSAGQRESSIPQDITMRISEPGVVATLARCAVGSWSGVETEALSSTADRWRGIAAELDMKSSQESTNDVNARIRVVLDGDHQMLVDNCGTSAHARVFVASNDLGTLSKILSIDVNTDLGAPVVGIDIVYARSDRDEAWISDVSYRLGEMGGSLRRVEGFHGEVLITDGTVCITSYKFLSAVSGARSSGAREIGVVIEGEQVVDWLWRKLRSQLVEGAG